MSLILHRPAPALAPFIAHLWHYEDAAGSLVHARERIMPTGRAQLLVNLHEDELRTYQGEAPRRTRGAALGGPTCGHFMIDTAEQQAIMGVSFHAGGTLPFFAAPADALRDTEVELDQLWGREGALLRERLLEQPTPQRRLRTLEAVLLAQVVGPLTPDPAMAAAIAALAGDVPVAKLCERLGLSPRRLIANFSAQVGLTPKRFARVCRFQRVLAAISRRPRLPWAELAVSCGYFDQPHLIHDFKKFSGLHPTAYAPRGPGGENHVIVA